jgi:hypothetical protein
MSNLPSAQSFPAAPEWCATTHASVAANPNGAATKARKSRRQRRSNPTQPRSDRSWGERRSDIYPDTERKWMLVVVPIVLALVLLSGVVLIASGLTADFFEMR